MHGDHVEGPSPVVQSCDDERAPDLLAGQPVEHLDSDILDRQAGQQSETPLAVLDGAEVASTGPLGLGEGPVLVEVEAVLAGEVGEHRLPGAPADAGRDPLTGGEGGERAVHH